MAAQRTKKEKIKARVRRQKTAPKSRTTSSSKKAAHVNHVSDLLHYDTSLIVRDLTRTLISTLVVFGVLVALYYQL